MGEVEKENERDVKFHYVFIQYVKNMDEVSI